MTDLTEQRLLSAHQLGRRDYQEDKPLLAPVYFSKEEQEVYTAGYLGERRRANGSPL